MYAQFRTVNIAVSKMIAGFQRYYEENKKPHTIEMQNEAIEKKKTYTGTHCTSSMRNHPIQAVLQITERHGKNMVGYGESERYDMTTQFE